MRRKFGLFNAGEVDAIAQHAADQVLRSHPTWQEDSLERGGGGVGPLDQDFKEYIEKGPALFTYFSAASDVISTMGASVPLRLYAITGRGENTEEEEVTDHPLLERLANPNPWDGSFSWRFACFQFLCYTGEAILSGISNNQLASSNPWGERLDEVWWLRPDRMKPVPIKGQRSRGNAENPISHWEYTSGSASVKRFERDTIIQIKWPNPRDPWRGLSPMKKLEPSLALEYEAVRWATDFFKNGAQIGTIIAGERELDAKGQQAFREAFRKRKRFDPIYVWGEKISFKEHTSNPKDALLEGFLAKGKRDQLAMLHVPPFAVSDLEHASWANAREQQRSLLTLGVMPACRLVETTLNASPLVTAWNTDAVRYALRHDFSGEEALQADKKAQAETDALYIRTGVRTRNEIRVLRSFGEPLDGGDVPGSLEGGGALAGLGSFETEDEDIDKGRSVFRELRSVAWEVADEKKKRGLLWRAVIHRLEPIESAWARRVLPMMREIGRDIVEAVSAKSGAKRDADDLIPPGFSIEELVVPEDYVARWGEAWGSVSRRTMKAGANDVLEEIAGTVPFDVTTPAVTEYLRERTAKKITTIATSRLKEVAAVIEKGIAAGESMGQLEKSLRTYYTDNAEFFALRVARTESMGLYNAGGLEGMRQGGVKKKQWLSARDADTRDSHVFADGQTVGVSELFTVGNSTCQHPGGTGDPAEDINCRCTHIAILAKD